MGHPFRLLGGFALWTILQAGAAAAQTPTTHRNLDWEATRRWVHIDNVDPAKAELFENSRRTWLAALTRDGQKLGDGRPLFWHARSGKVQTYFTLYPFNKWAEMDARGEMITQTNATVGEQAVTTYDLGDAALVPPHCSQIWRRAEAADIAWAGNDSLTEVSAPVGRLEIHQVDWWHWSEFEKLWAEIKAALVAQRYPLACRAYTNAYGDNQGEYILLWLAPDAPAYREAPTLQAALARALGEQKCRETLASLEAYFPRQTAYEVERRLDLSNLER
jgi:hypothetical protein